MTLIKNKYVFTGEIVLESALHIGSGKVTHETDAAILKTANDEPYIPGSSLKGVLRTICERLYNVALKNPSFKDKDICFLGEEDCSNPSEEAKKLFKKYMEDNSVQKMADWISTYTCPACQLYGSSLQASKVIVHDAYLTDESKKVKKKTMVRHSVAIDRETGTAEQGAKFDYEVANKDLVFNFKITAENLEKMDLKLLLLGLNEFEKGRIQLGGNISKGLGHVQLKNGEVEIFDFSTQDNQAKEAYLHFLLDAENNNLDNKDSNENKKIDTISRGTNNRITIRTLISKTFK
ncbi:CRISPR-associated RAMP protein Csx7 [Bacillus sp. 165]|uniref:type III CRISPR-associated RAMP protein Csx7 n=1 Tax=Bacillus sp. 165 TaxID=1529117 RepID=UPI001AD9E311|nr:CRISPR-associated RAMP protein [Bacillus sp. 165]